MHTMLAGRFHQDSKKFAVEEVPVPVPGPGEILIEVKAAGVCLSDVHLLDGSLVPLFATSYTVTVGHEVAGVIHTLGPDLKRGLTVGTRVTLEAGKICGQCVGCVRRRPCTQMLTAGIDYDGGWAQYTLAHEDMLIPIPDNLPFDQDAIIPDAVSTPYAAVVATAGRGLDFAFDCAGVPAVREQAASILGLNGALILVGISPRPLTITEGLTFNYLNKQVNKGDTMATETQATAAPQGGIMAATGNTDATTFPPPQLPSARLEHRRAGVLTHTPWAGWYYETDSD